MKKTILCLSLLPLFASAQNEFYNKGADITVQKGAMIYVQGSMTNDNGSVNGNITNNGVIELQGDFENKANATLVQTDNSSTERVIKFIGSGTQAIKGNLSTAGSASFYNLLADKSVSATPVQMQTNALVEGSLVFGSNTSANTYTPTANSTQTNNSGKGVIQTYNGGTEYELYVSNSANNAVAGYATMNIAPNPAPTDAYIQNSGQRGIANGGFSRLVTTSASYVYPVGSAARGYNPSSFSFATIPGGATDKLRGKFCDVPNGQSTGHVTQMCIGCSTQFPSPDNLGINVLYGSGTVPNPCGGAKQWVILEDGVTGHGYWSFESASQVANTANKDVYTMETFPHGYTDLGWFTDTWRTMKYEATMSDDIYAMNVNWNDYLWSVQNVSDVLEYTRVNLFGATLPAPCYQGNGVPGGVYTGFSDFGVKKAHSNNSLPVELIYLKADAINNQYIEVSWATATEINNRGFDVMRSTDGSNWTNIGWMYGHNNSTVQNNYSFNDVNITPNILYYYKLNQQDNDGHSQETYVVSAMLTLGVVFTVSDFVPNPANEASKIIINTSVSQNIDVKLYDLLGREMSAKNYMLSIGQNEINFDTQTLADATYSAVITADNKVYSKKLVVQKN